MALKTADGASVPQVPSELRKQAEKEMKKRRKEEGRKSKGEANGEEGGEELEEEDDGPWIIKFVARTTTKKQRNLQLTSLSLSPFLFCLCVVAKVLDLHRSNGYYAVLKARREGARRRCAHNHCSPMKLLLWI